ncbi:MAG: hypothetical protein ABR540_16290 [Acidimicrobiales bacterium]
MAAELLLALDHQAVARSLATFPYPGEVASCWWAPLAVLRALGEDRGSSPASPSTLPPPGA